MTEKVMEFCKKWKSREIGQSHELLTVVMEMSGSMEQTANFLHFTRIFAPLFIDQFSYVCYKMAICTPVNL